MKIKPNASSEEKASPFYKANELFCSEFEEFITNKGGSVEGNYNAWSYNIHGEITNPKKWNIAYKKSTFTSGNLLLSSEYQSLFVMAMWETDRKNDENNEFLIRRKVGADFFMLLLRKSFSKYDKYDKYVMDIKDDKPQIFFKITYLLKNLFETNEIYKIEHRKNKLKIELRTKNQHFELLDKLIAIESSPSVY